MKRLLAGVNIWLHGVIEILIFFPFYLVISYFIVPMEEVALWAAHLTLYYAAGYTVYRLLPLKRYLIYPLLLLAVCGIAYGFNGPSLAFVVSLIVGGFLCVRGVKAYFTPWHELFHTKYYWIGLVFYFIASALFGFIDAMESYQPIVFWLGATSLAVTLLESNQKILKKETLSGKHADHQVASPIVWQNRILIGISLILIVLVGLIGKVREGVSWIGEKISSFFSQIARIRDSVTGSSSTEMPGTKGTFGEDGGVNVDPSGLALSLQTILFYIVFVLLAIAALILLFFAGKYLLRGLKKWIAWFRGNIGQSKVHRQEDAAFEDERERLLSMRQLRKKVADRMKNWLSGMLEKEPKWSELPNNIERIRYLYRQVLLRYMHQGYAYKSSNTPLETSRELAKWDDRQLYPMEDIVDYYNQARYSHDELIEARPKLEEMKKQIEGTGGLRKA